MKLSIYQKVILIFVYIGIIPFNGFAQENTTILTQNPRFEGLLNEKRKINPSITITDVYKIQIYSGDNEASKNSLAEFRNNNKATDATIVFSTPIYKVWVGSYKTRIEAEKKLQEIKKKYPNCFIIKPNR